MQKLTDAGENIVNDIASRYHLSHDAVVHMLVAVNNGGGSMAQFNCPELGGSGQWMRGGMIMVGDMFNHGLKMTVNNLCCELSSALANNQIFPIIPAGTPGSNHWWPSELGTPFSSGAQNNIRYAVFPHRLAVELNGQVSVYDTLNHNISGVSQQQGNNTSLTFNSQFGTIAVNNLPLISGQAEPPAPQSNFAAPITETAFAPESNQNNKNDGTPAQPLQNNMQSSDMINRQYDINDTLEIIGKLAKLRDANAITEEDFNNKKAELLSRI